MSYIVLARKYRPQTFDDVYAQEHVTTVLKNAITTNRLAHAFLFTGSRGVGKTSMARILAKSLNCIEGVSANPCGVCDNCVEITNGTSTDVVEIDGASNTGVEDIRDLQKELMYSTSKSKYKIFIIDEVHMLSKNAFNALLKTLEEPPPQVLFIFATTEPHKVLPTIISRCQRYDFKRIPVDQIVKRLKYICEKEEITIQEEALYVIAKKAEGSMRDALSLTDQLIATTTTDITANDVLSLFGIVNTEVYHKVTEYIRKKEAAAIVALIHSLLDKGNDLQEFLNGYLDYLRNLLLTKTKVPLPELHSSLKKALQEVEPLFSEDKILYLMAVLIKTKTEIKYFSNPVLLVEMTFIKLCKMEEMTSISELLQNWNYSAQPQPTRVNTSKAPAAKQTRYVHSQSPASNKVKESPQPKPKYEVITKEIFEKEREGLINDLRKSTPFAAQYFEDIQLVGIKERCLDLKTDKQIAYSMLNKDKQRLANFVSRYFGTQVGLNFILEENRSQPAAPKKTKLSLDEIEKESPNLADFIKKSSAKVTPINTR